MYSTPGLVTFSSVMTLVDVTGLAYEDDPYLS